MPVPKKILKKYAREHRNSSTKAEVRTWCELLRAKKMKGYSFLRQFVIESYIVDFCCRKLKLVIEIDGFTHEDPLVQQKDKLREIRLNELGYTVLRFTDYEIHKQLEEVRLRLEEWIQCKEEAGKSPVLKYSFGSHTPFSKGDITQKKD